MKKQHIEKLAKIMADLYDIADEVKSTTTYTGRLVASLRNNTCSWVNQIQAALVDDNEDKLSQLFNDIYNE